MTQVNEHYRRFLETHLPWLEYHVKTAKTQEQLDADFAQFVRDAITRYNVCFPPAEPAHGAGIEAADAQRALP